MELTNVVLTNKLLTQLFLVILYNVTVSVMSDVPEDNGADELLVY